MLRCVSSSGGSAARCATADGEAANSFVDVSEGDLIFRTEEAAKPVDPLTEAAALRAKHLADLAKEGSAYEAERKAVETRYKKKEHE